MHVRLLPESNWLAPEHRNTVGLLIHEPGNKNRQTNINLSLISKIVRYFKTSLLYFIILAKQLI